MASVQKTAFITGVTGQDGALLAQFLLGKGYMVHGLRLYSASEDSNRFRSFINAPNFHLHYGDLTDAGNLWRLLREIKPDEIYNLGAMSHVQVSFTTPEAAADINALGTLRLLEAVRGLDLQETTRFYQASSSEMFGNAPAPQNEKTAFAPCSPYGVAKLYAYWMVRNYRETYGIHASNGILFNHESPLRGEEFVTRKISKAIAAIVAGQQEKLSIGNLDAGRDWGYAGDYVTGMWSMLQQDMPDDYVLATGEVHTVREFITLAFECAGIVLEWRGKDIEEKAFDKVTGKILVDVDPQFFRPAEIYQLIGDASKAREKLNWQPKIDFAELVKKMVLADINAQEERSGFGQNLRAAE